MRQFIQPRKRRSLYPIPASLAIPILARLYPRLTHTLRSTYQSLQCQLGRNARTAKQINNKLETNLTQVTTKSQISITTDNLTKVNKFTTASKL
jgi:hypothetical protein